MCQPYRELLKMFNLLINGQFEKGNEPIKKTIEGKSVTDHVNKKRGIEQPRLSITYNT